MVATWSALRQVLLAGVLFIPLLWVGARRPSGLLRAVRLDRLAFHSYSLYLTHGSIVIFLAAMAPALLSGWAGVVSVILAANLFALLFAATFEIQHVRVRRALLTYCKLGSTRSN